MTPFVFEWQWDVGHGVFMGFFYLALSVVGLGVLGALGMTFYDVYSGHIMHDSSHQGEDPWEDYFYLHDKADRGEYN